MGKFLFSRTAAILFKISCINFNSNIHQYSHVIADVPKLPELKKPVEEEEEEEEEEVEDEVEEEPKQKASKKSSKSSSKSKVASGPPAADPYAEDSSSLIMPIMIAFALFVPTLACLCRL